MKTTALVGRASSFMNHKHYIVVIKLAKMIQNLELKLVVAGVKDEDQKTPPLVLKPRLDSAPSERCLGKTHSPGELLTDHGQFLGGTTSNGAIFLSSSYQVGHHFSNFSVRNILVASEPVLT